MPECLRIRVYFFNFLKDMVIIMKIYVTEAGDSLYSIGKKFGVTIEQLISANGHTVTPSLIKRVLVLQRTAVTVSLSVLVLSALTVSLY